MICMYACEAHSPGECERCGAKDGERYYVSEGPPAESRLLCTACMKVVTRGAAVRAQAMRWLRLRLRDRWRNSSWRVGEADVVNRMAGMWISAAGHHSREQRHEVRALLCAVEAYHACHAALARDGCG